MKWLNELDIDKLIIILLFLLIVIICGSVTSCTVSGNNSAERLLNSGKTSLEVNCAISRGQDMEAACLAAGMASK